jgi:argininosuccinate synthase
VSQVTDNGKVVLAYSGGLDTSYCIPYLREKRGYQVISVTVDTGGFAAGELEAIEARAKALGVLAHHTVDARRDVYQKYASYLIKGNVLRGAVYPLSVAAERTVQAEAVAAMARREGAQAVAHGSTGAGNDQIRFDIAFSVLCPGLKVIVPIREEKLSRKEEFEFLRARGVEIEKRAEEYSINVGLWGTTIGGGPTHDPWKEIPEEVYQRAAGVEPAGGREYVQITFDQGLPVALDGRRMDGVPLIGDLGTLCRRHRVGRAVHLGDTVLGIKGRVAFEAGAAIVVIHAHRELEKLTTTHWQRFWKDHLADFYGKMLHEGHAFEPALRDIEALIDRSQERVSGDVRVRLDDGAFQVVGVKSPYSLAGAAAGVYGEMPKLWTADDPRGYSAIAGIPARLYRDAGARGAQEER